MRLVLQSITSFFIGLSLAYLLFYQEDTSSRPAPPSSSSTDSLSHDPYAYDESTLQIRTPSCAGISVDVLVLIFSHPHSIKQRQVVRETWLSDLRYLKTAAHLFVLKISKHKPSLLESEQYNDILFINTQQYNSKMLLSALNWSAVNINFQHLLKCNDHSYISVAKLMPELRHLPNKRLLWGYFVGNQNVTRNGHKAEQKWNLCLSYLPYVQGGGYVLSKDLVTYIVHVGPYLDHTDNEDIGLGVWMSPLKDIKRHHDIRFNTGPSSRGCMNQYLITHPETSESMTNKHKLLKDKGYLCQNEIETIKSYHYNWTAPVTLCCK
ncbi:PREDICTED: beta-1,3-galactosyltransferase 6-like [Amphimedon queenslandica]|uniref:Hexosyltransferase n=2 Tax=Amphimedon queenslandica TaxID=400682 RepID=A0AAN0IAL8_AMPQE|nr:PREDICTED: beta-1,3-galactosyltransferase 6-like [Amphimedon queenslandica]|eukprot:XP_003384004.1 PREDICTED: beta-1,3-galactosyltransferase 6-like [Amphimedon queenslandica]